MSRFLVASTLACVVVVAGCASAPRSSPVHFDDAARFEKFKAMAGAWTATGQGDAPAGAKMTYRLTAGGSAVVETVFEGTPHEMATVYTLDHGRLRLTHYCALGNQPGMVALPSADADVIDFEFDSLGNGDPATGMHMHRAQFSFADPAKVRSRWTLWKDGQEASSVVTEIVRAN